MIYFSFGPELEENVLLRGCGHRSVLPRPPPVQPLPCGCPVVFELQSPVVLLSCFLSRGGWRFVVGQCMYDAGFRCHVCSEFLFFSSVYIRAFGMPRFVEEQGIKCVVRVYIHQYIIVSMQYS